jgi:hypothetical protein
MSAPTIIIRTEASNHFTYSMGYVLTRTNDRFDIVDVSHGSMCDTEDFLGDVAAAAYSVDEIIQMATRKSEPRIPDIQTTSKDLLALYDSILQHQSELLTWQPSEGAWFLDFIRMPPPH